MRRIFLLLCFMSITLSAAPPAHAQGPTFTKATCMVNISQYGAVEGRDVDCGYLTVPELHAKPDGPTIQLAVMIIHSTGSNPVATPLVMLQGGPGGSTIDTYSQLLFTTNADLRSQRTIVLFDQRGTLYSKPALACTEERDLLNQTLEQRLSREENYRLSLEALNACHDRLQRAGVNLAAYNSIENAADVEDLRVALGYAQIDLYGVSYGTLLAQHVMKEHPQGLRSVLIDAVVPTSQNFVPDVSRSGNRAFGELFAACAADAACNASYPNLEQTLNAQISRLNTTPARIPLTDPKTGKTYNAVFDGDTFQGTLFQMFYATELIPLLPAAIDAVQHDNYTFFSKIMPVFIFDQTVSTGMYYSVICAEEADYDVNAIKTNDLRPIFAKNAKEDAAFIQQVCSRWGVRDLGPSVDAPVSSTVPTLVFSGRFDPITPPYYAAEAAQPLANSYSFTFPNTGHGALNSNDCARSIAESFWRDPSRAPDSSCIATLTPPTFITRENTLLSSAAANIVEWLNGRALLWPGIMGAALVVLLSLFLVWPLIWLIRLLMGRKAAPRPGMARLASITALLVALLGVVFIVGLGVVVFAKDLDGLVVLFLGFPRTAVPVLALAPLIALLALVMLIGAILAWVRGYWSVGERIYYSLLTIAALALTAGLGGTGLLTALIR